MSSRSLAKSTRPRSQRLNRGQPRPNATRSNPRERPRRMFDLDLPALGRTMQEMSPTSPEYAETCKIFLSARYRSLADLKTQHKGSNTITKQQWVDYWSSDDRGIDKMTRKVASKVFDTVLDPRARRRIPLGDIDKLAKTMQREWTKLIGKGDRYLSRFSWWADQLAATQPIMEEKDAASPAEEEADVTGLEGKVKKMEADTQRRRSQVSELVFDLQSARDEYETEIDELRGDLETERNRTVQMRADYEARIRALKATASTSEDQDLTAEEVKTEDVLDLPPSPLEIEQAARIEDLKAELQVKKEAAVHYVLGATESQATIASLRQELRAKNDEIQGLHEAALTLGEQTKDSWIEIQHSASKHERRLLRELTNLQTDLQVARTEIKDYRVALGLPAEKSNLHNQNSGSSSQRASGSGHGLLVLGYTDSGHSIALDEIGSPKSDDADVAFPEDAEIELSDEKWEESQATILVEEIEIDGSGDWDSAEFIHQFASALEENKATAGEADVYRLMNLLWMGQRRPDIDFDVNARVKQKRKKKFCVSTKPGDEPLFLKVIATENHQLIEEYMSVSGLDMNASSKKWSPICRGVSTGDVALLKLMLGLCVDFDLSVGFSSSVGGPISCVTYARQREFTEVVTLLEAYSAA